MANESPEMIVVTPTGDPEPEEAHFIQLQAQWEEHMKDLCPKRRYSRVSVLLLYWIKAGPSYLDTAQEIEDLTRVFEDRYHFKVLKGILNPGGDKKKAPQKWLQKYLADFVHEEDEKDSLLIVYYAGHGNPGVNGELILTGGNLSGVNVDHTAWAQAAWSQSEYLIHTADAADVLLIFDCCFAGKLSGTLDRRAFNTKNFEFLGATASNGLARLPGKESFSRALIWALNQLADEKDGFTTSRLYSKIIDAPDFPNHEQTPTLSERRGHCLKRLVLAPLDPNDDLPSNASPVEGQGQEDSFQYSLTLQLLFPKLLSNTEMEVMCKGLKELIRTEELKAKQIIWRGLHRKGASHFELPPLAQAFAWRWLSMTKARRKRTLSGVGNKEMPVLGKRPAPTQAPSPGTSEAPLEEESASESRSGDNSQGATPTRPKRPRLKTQNPSTTTSSTRRLRSSGKGGT